MGFDTNTNGLDALIAELKTRFAATVTGPMTPEQIFATGFSWGANYALPIDHTAFVALGTALDSPTNVRNALALQRTLDTAVATETANDATRATADTADATAHTNAQNAVNAFTPA